MSTSEQGRRGWVTALGVVLIVVAAGALFAAWRLFLGLGDAGGSAGLYLLGVIGALVVATAAGTVGIVIVNRS